MANETDREEEVVRLLVEHGADPNARDQTGTTALTYAMKAKGNAEDVSYLLAHGAKP